jgi:hypothetical protein
MAEEELDTTPPSPRAPAAPSFGIVPPLFFRSHPTRPPGPALTSPQAAPSLRPRSSHECEIIAGRLAALASSLHPFT